MCKESPKCRLPCSCLLYSAECSSVPWSRCHAGLCSSLTSSRGQEQSKHQWRTTGEHSASQSKRWVVSSWQREPEAAQFFITSWTSLRSSALQVPRDFGNQTSFVSSLLTKFKCLCWILYFLLADLNLPLPQNEDSHSFATIFNTSCLPVGHCQLRPITHVTALSPYPSVLVFPTLDSVSPTQTTEAII